MIEEKKSWLVLSHDDDLTNLVLSSTGQAGFFFIQTEGEEQAGFCFRLKGLIESTLYFATCNMNT